MSRKVLVNGIEQNGVVFGRKARADSIADLQEFAHNHTEQLTDDFITNKRAVAGFDFAFPENFTNTRQIEILAPGRVYEADGKQFELSVDTTLTVPDADADFGRIDAIVAVLDADVATGIETVSFRRLRTQTEIEAGDLTYPETQFNAATEQLNRATVVLKPGTPGENITLPLLAANEILLYTVNVAANTNAIQKEDVGDARSMIRTLATVDQETALARRETSRLTTEVQEIRGKLGNMVVDLTPINGKIMSLAEVLANLMNRVNALSAQLPEIPTDLAPHDPNGGKLQAVGNFDEDVPVVDIELGSYVRFSDQDVPIHPEMFPESVNARFVKVGGGTATQQLSTALLLANTTLIDSDGDTDFKLQNAEFVSGRSRPACAPRDNRYVEIFGGLAANNASALGDWLTYDTFDDTITPRTFTGAQPPSASRPAMFPCGDGSNVLLACNSATGNNARWFHLNATTGVCTEKTGNIPGGSEFIGDLTAPGVAFVCAVRKESSGAVASFWRYDFAAGVFTELGTFGSVPEFYFGHTAGCILNPNEFILVTYRPGESGSGKTYVFNLTNLTWTLTSIGAPYAGNVERQLPLANFEMANVNGRVQLVGGNLANLFNPKKGLIWELQPSLKNESESETNIGQWRPFNVSILPLSSPGFCSTFAYETQKGKAFLFGGTDKFSTPLKNVFASIQGGLIAANYNGSDGISLAESATFATFSLAMHTAPWDIGAYFAQIAGRYEPGEIKVEVSWDDGLTWTEIALNYAIPVGDSSNPGKRRIKITLFGLGKTKPVLTNLSEIFDADGVQLQTRIVLRYNAVLNQTRALYIDRLGNITIEAVIAPSTPDKALLQKVTHAGFGVAPTVKNYINKRKARLRIEGVSDGSAASTRFDNPLAVPPAWIDARGATGNDNILYQVPTPAVGFDQVVTLTNIEPNDKWIVELES